MANKFHAVFVLLVLLAPTVFSANRLKVDVQVPVVQTIVTEVSITGLLPSDSVTAVLVNGKPISFERTGDQLIIVSSFDNQSEITILFERSQEVIVINPIPIWLSVLPPLIAILLALLFREVLTSLFLGILSGAVIIYLHQGVGFFYAVFKGLLAVVDTYLIHALLDQSHLCIIVFSMMIGGMVALVTLNGGMQGVVGVLSRYANSRRSGQLITYLMGLFIFFDDYANTLVVGNTMRPLTDKLKISREKLAYLVDSTSAPVAAIAFVTTWIGAELSYIQSGLVHTQINESAYHVFLSSLKYSFYPLFTLAFVAIVVLSGRDFGPMRRAESRTFASTANHKRYLQGGSTVDRFEPLPNVTPRWFNAMIPVLVLVIGTLVGLLYTGWDSREWQNSGHPFLIKLSAVIGRADTYKALLWSSFLGVLTAIVMSMAQRILNLGQAINGLINGFKAMFNAIVILLLAWGIAHITEQLHTADFISLLIVNGALSPFAVPALTFVLSALVSFSTGTSWGTMAIVYPLILPATWRVCTEAGLDIYTCEALFHQTVASVLAGAVMGDHISPISDTTILSSLASSCNHIQHVRTQIPYSLTVGFVSVGAGVLPVAFGMPVWISFFVGIGLLYLIIWLVGARTGQ